MDFCPSVSAVPPDASCRAAVTFAYEPICSAFCSVPWRATKTSHSSRVPSPRVSSSSHCWAASPVSSLRSGSSTVISVAVAARWPAKTLRSTKRVSPSVMSNLMSGNASRLFGRSALVSLRSAFAGHDRATWMASAMVDLPISLSPAMTTTPRSGNSSTTRCSMPRTFFSSIECSFMASSPTSRFRPGARAAPARRRRSGGLPRPAPDPPSSSSAVRRRRAGSR